MGPRARDQRAPAVFHGVHRLHGLLPSQPTPQRLPKVGSRNVSATGTMKDESLSVRVQTEYSLLAPAYTVSMPSAPWMW
jgi:hypothetical protein